MYKKGRILVLPMSRRSIIAITLIGILFTTFGSLQAYPNLRLYSKGLKTEGTVTSIVRIDENSYLDVQFVNEKTDKQVTVRTNYNVRYGEIGNKVAVLYDPGNPIDNLIGLNLSNVLLERMFGAVVFLLIGIFLLISAFYSARGQFFSFV